jgi:hypothetical protein
VPRDVEMQNAPTVVADDKKTVEHTEGDCWQVKKSIATMASRWLRKNASQRLAGPGSRGALRIQREMVRWETSQPSMSSSP